MGTVSFNPKVSKHDDCILFYTSHPKDRDIVCIVGQNVFKMCKLIEGNLKPFGFLKGEALSCLDHAWLSNKHVLVAGEGGKASSSLTLYFL